MDGNWFLESACKTHCMMLVRGSFYDPTRDMYNGWSRDYRIPANKGPFGLALRFVSFCFAYHIWQVVECSDVPDTLNEGITRASCVQSSTPQWVAYHIRVITARFGHNLVICSNCALPCRVVYTVHHSHCDTVLFYECMLKIFYNVQYIQISTLISIKCVCKSP